MTTLDVYNFELPKELIALYPAAQRTHSRLLSLDATGTLRDQHFYDLPSLLQPGDLLVINDSKVIRARLNARKPSGGKVEIMLERLLDTTQALVRLNASKAPKPQSLLQIDHDASAEPAPALRVIERQGEFFLIAIDDTEHAMDGVMDMAAVFERFAEIALPPYIQRPAEADDQQHYQTVYATHPGSVAAPTAGLHFDEVLLKQISDKGVDIQRITLHIGSGTYAPIRDGNLETHTMHEERFSIAQDLCDAIDACRQRNGRIIAVGTTTVRVLETLAQRAAGSTTIEPCHEQTTDLFIRPGFTFRLVDVMITNFHLPQTTLFVLVCTFAGQTRMQAAYAHAIHAAYRFFSYGDAMWIERPEGSDAI